MRVDRSRRAGEIHDEREIGGTRLGAHPVVSTSATSHVRCRHDEQSHAGPSRVGGEGPESACATATTPIPHVAGYDASVARPVTTPLRERPRRNHRLTRSGAPASQPSTIRWSAFRDRHANHFLCRRYEFMAGDHDRSWRNVNRSPGRTAPLLAVAQVLVVQLNAWRSVGGLEASSCSPGDLHRRHGITPSAPDSFRSRRFVVGPSTFLRGEPSTFDQRRPDQRRSNRTHIAGILLRNAGESGCSNYRFAWLDRSRRVLRGWWSTNRGRPPLAGRVDTFETMTPGARSGRVWPAAEMKSGSRTAPAQIQTLCTVAGSPQKIESVVTCRANATKLRRRRNESNPITSAVTVRHSIS